MARSARRRLAGVTLLLGFGITACALTTLDGLSGVPLEPDGGDAGPPGVGVPLADSAPLLDATIADATLGFCASHPDAAFCDEFERENILFGWDTSYFSVGAEAGLSDARAVSPTRSLHVTVDESDAGANANLIKTFPAPTAVHLRMSLFLESVDTTNQGGFVLLTLDNGGGTSLSTALRNLPDGPTVLTETVVSDGGAAFSRDYTLERSLHTGAWEDIDLTWSFAGAVPTFQVFFGSEEVLPVTNGDGQTGPLAVRLPLYFVGPRATGWSVFADNVLLETTP